MRYWPCPLRSYSQPLIIMSVIPFAFVGAVWGHLIMKTFGYVSGLAMMSVLGFAAASGVVVNSSLVLVHSVNFRSGKRRAPERGCPGRRRIALPADYPDLADDVYRLVTLDAEQERTGAVPGAHGGVALVWRAMFATVVTLLVVPSGYLILHDLGRLLKKSKGERPATLS